MKPTVNYILLLLAVNPLLFNVSASIRITSFSCFMNKASIANGTCTYKAMRNKFGNFTVAGTLLRPIPKLSLEIKSFIKGSSNVYRRGPINIVHDLCVKESPTAAMIFHFNPSLRPAYDQMIQKCPYKGNFTLKNFIIDNLDDNGYIPFVPTGDVKTMFRFTDIRRSLTVIELNATCYVKAKSLSLLQV